MFVEEQLAGISAGQQAMQTMATVWALTSFQYPPDALSSVKNGLTDFDYCVIGAGSAGAVVAARLSENPNVTVLLLEAGGDPPIESNLPGGSTFLQNSYMDWDQIHQTQEDKEGYQCLRNQRQPVSHGKLLGGGSSINLMMYMRGHPHDFDRWADISEDDSWRYENVLKYFIKSENLKDDRMINSPFAKYHGTEGPMGVTKLWSDAAVKYLDIYEEMGYPHVMDLNSNGSLGFNEQMVTAADGQRQSTANAHLAQAKDRDNLYVVKNAIATKVIMNEDKKATGVEFYDKDNNTYTITVKKEVVLSAGAINSPKILMHSGIGPKEQLEKYNIPVAADLPVGQKLINHHGIFLIYKVDKLDPTAKQPAQDPKEFPVPIVTGLWTLNKTQSYPDAMYATVVMDASAMALTFCAILFAFDKQTCQTLYEDCKGREVLFAAIVDFNQKSRGHISLKSSDPLDPPDIHIVAYPDEESFENVLDNAEDFHRIVNTTHFKEVGGEIATLPQCAEHDKTGRDYLGCFGRCLSSTYYHYAATNAMGSVVDSQMCVYGTEGLRVCDSSAMPAITSGTPNAAIIMLAEKCADMIKEANEL